MIVDATHLLNILLLAFDTLLQFSFEARHMAQCVNAKFIRTFFSQNYKILFERQIDRIFLVLLNFIDDFVMFAAFLVVKADFGSKIRSKL